MSWVRKGNNRYYRRSLRIGERVITEHCGGGARGDRAARRDQMNRSRRARQREADRAVAAELLRDNAQVARAVNHVDRIVSRALESGGVFASCPA